jgi:hypothetical protein
MTEAGLKLRPSKCKFGYKRLRVMGSIISGEERVIDQEKVNAFEKMERPKTGAGMKAMLGFVNYLREYVPLYSVIMEPMEKLRNCKKIRDGYEWGKEQEKAWRVLKKALGQAPVLSLPDWDREFRVGVDSSQGAVGAMLYQIGDDGKRRYIAFGSKTLTAGQRNYPAPKRELLAIVYALKKWREVLWGRRFVVESDHKALCYIRTSNTYMIRDWLEFILEFDFEVRHKKGFLNILPDCLSRCYDEVVLDSVRTREARDEVRRGALVLECGQKVGEEDEVEMREVRPVFDFKTAELQTDEVDIERPKWSAAKFVKDILGREEPGSEEEKREMVRRQHHMAHTGGYGMFKVLFREGWFWEGMYKECQQEARGCMECLRHNVGRVGFHPLRPITATLPWDHILMDIAGPFKTADGGYNYLLVFVDVATRFVVLRPLRTKTSSEIAEVMYKMMGDFGVPKMMQYDADPSFLSQVIEKFREQCGFERRVIMPYTPRINGAVERMILEVKHLLLKRVNGEIKTWIRYVPATQLALNQRIVSRHRSSPFALLFARKVNEMKNYEEVEAKIATEDELEERGRRMVEAVYPEVEKVSREVGEKGCKEDGEKRRGMRKERLKNGTKVMKRVDVRGSKGEERWEGIYVVVGFNAREGGYSLLDDTGALMKNRRPLEDLQVVQAAAVEEDEMFEVKKIEDHQGEEGCREYWVKWVGEKEGGWVKEEYFGSKAAIRDYWEKVDKKKKREASKNRRKEKRTKAGKEKEGGEIQEGVSGKEEREGEGREIEREGGGAEEGEQKDGEGEEEQEVGVVSREGEEKGTKEEETRQEKGKGGVEETGEEGWEKWKEEKKTRRGRVVRTNKWREGER